MNDYNRRTNDNRNNPPKHNDATLFGPILRGLWTATGGRSSNSNQSHAGRGGDNNRSHAGRGGDNNRSGNGGGKQHATLFGSIIDWFLD